MVNNIELIKPFLEFETEDDFYILDIIKRRKENPKLDKNHIDITHYFITSIKELDKVMPDVISICDATNSRAYINLNSRSFEMIALYLNKKVGEIIVQKDFKFLRRAYVSECHSRSNEKDKTWIVDFDFTNGVCSEDDTKKLEEVKESLIRLQKQTGAKPMINEIPTKNGIHIITRPFNAKKFSELYPKIDVHKDGPTLLYIS